MMEVSNAQSDTTDTRFRRQFGLGTLLLLTCAAGTVGGLFARSFDTIAGVMFSSFYVFRALAYGSMFVGPLMSLFVLVQLACEKYRPVSAILHLVVGGLTLAGLATGDVGEDVAAWVAFFLVLIAIGCWVEVVVCEVWPEHWATALAMTLATGSWTFLIAAMWIARAGA